MALEVLADVAGKASCAYDLFCAACEPVLRFGSLAQVGQGRLIGMKLVSWTVQFSQQILRFWNAIHCHFLFNAATLSLSGQEFS